MYRHHRGTHAQKKGIPISNICVIIVNYNAGDWLQRSVDSIAAQTLSDFECVIVDNGSTDGSLDALKLPDDRFEILALGKNTGFAKANNIAAKQTNAKWIALLNPDAFARADWLENLLAATPLAPNITMVGSTQFLALADTPTLDGVGDCYHISGVAYRAGYGHAIDPPETGLVFGPCAAAALYERATFTRLGGFDESFFCYHEDVDMALRMQIAGGDCVQSRAAVVDHVSSAISNTVPKFAVYHGTRNRIWTYFKSMPLGPLILFLPLHIAANITYLLWAAFRPGRFRPTARGVWDGVKGLPRIMKARKSVQASRTISQFAILPKLTWSALKVAKRGIHIRKLP